MLERVRTQLMETEGLSLPDRFESVYFFESINDCLEYKRDLSDRVGSNIIEVDLFDSVYLYRFDNRLIGNFLITDTAQDYRKAAEKYLKRGMSADPLIEVIYKGKFRIISHRPT